VLALAVNSVAYSQGAVTVNDTTYYLISEAQARTVILLDADATALERENILLHQRLAVKDSIIEARSGQVGHYAAIDTAQVEVIESRGERIELSKRQRRREEARKVGQDIAGFFKRTWREFTIATAAAGAGYAVGHFSTR
jgi:hypothetical protein